MRGALAGAAMMELVDPQPAAGRELVATSRATDGLNPWGRRVLEVIPPVIAWVALTSPIWAAIVAPELLSYFLVAFSAYWLWRSAEFTVGLLLGLWRLRVARERDWVQTAERVPGFGHLQHVVILPTYRESDAVLSETLECLVRQTMPHE